MCAQFHELYFSHFFYPHIYILIAAHQFKIFEYVELADIHNPFMVKECKRHVGNTSSGRRPKSSSWRRWPWWPLPPLDFGSAFFR